MAGFIRRFRFDPGLEELTAIEGVVIIDRDPPASITGLGSGTVLLVGEFEDGCFDDPVEVFSGNDFQTQFGGFGYSYDGVRGNNPSARARRADNALVDEYWNGNGFVAAANKRFRRLIVTRVDTTVGQVSFTRLANVVGSSDFNWNLEPGWYLSIDLDQNASTATVADLDSAAGTSPQVMTGGEQMQVTVDSGTPLAQTITFTAVAGALSQADLINELNVLFGDVLASDQGAGVTRISSRAAGTAGNVTIDSIDALLTTLTGYNALDTASGTGTSPTFVTFNGAVATLDSAAGSYPTGFAGGESMTITIDEGTTNQIGPVQVFFLSTDTTQALAIDRINAALGYTAASDQGGDVTRLVGRVRGTGGNVKLESVDLAVTTALGFVAGTTAGTGNVSDIDQVTFTEAKTVIEAASASLLVERDSSDQIRVSNTSTSGTTRTIQVVGGTAATAFGFNITAEGDAFVGVDDTIPAGSRVRDGSANEWVVARTVSVTEDNPGPYQAYVRPAVDDGTTPAAAVGAVTVVPFAFGADAWSAINTGPLTAALTEAQLDAAYVTAIDATLNANKVSRETNIIVSARQSNAVRVRLRSNALQASAEGLRGRMAVMRPPLKTKRSVALSTAAQPGVGAYRDQRVVYAFPGAQTFLPQIAERGVAGGDGFTADGIIDTGFDTWVASVMSQLPPEENPGQLTDFMTNVLGIERDNADVQDMRIGDYKAFRRQGIAALRMDDGTAIIQSGVTSVNPSVFPNLRNIARRRMADFIQDSIATRMKAFVKKLSTPNRRGEVVGEIQGFLDGLKSTENPSLQRIDDYFLDGVTGNTPDALAAGVFRVIIKVRTLPSLDVIVLDTTIGESVDVSEAA